jgi:hypothetical protein
MEYALCETVYENTSLSGSTLFLCTPKFPGGQKDTYIVSKSFTVPTSTSCRAQIWIRGIARVNSDSRLVHVSKIPYRPLKSI